MRKISILGGGLAGLAAAEALLASFLRGEVQVHLFERQAYFGGRAAMAFHVPSAPRLDVAQHLTMPCCPTFLAFLERTGLRSYWKTQEHMTFFSRTPQGTSRMDLLRNASFWPQPFALVGSLLRFRFLSFGERWELLRTLRRVQKQTPPHGILWGDWLEELGCRARVRRLFFEPLTLSAFCELPEDISAERVKQLLDVMFLGDANAWYPILPQEPLQTIWNERMAPFWAKSVADGRLVLRPNTPIQRVQVEPSAPIQVFPKDAEPQTFDACILAVPWHMANTLVDGVRIVQDETFFSPRTIAAVHVWTEQPLFSSPNIVLPGAVAQWIFRSPFGDRREAAYGQKGFYHQVLLSHSDVVCSSQKEILRQIVMEELERLFPEAQWNEIQVIRIPQAVFSWNDFQDRRPKAQTAFENLFLAGDWTATGLPATMEGAVQSGQTAANLLLRYLSSRGKKV